MNQDREDDDDAKVADDEKKVPVVRLIGDAETIPVFSCQILISHDSGKVVAESANIAGISATAKNEREALRTVVEELKSRLKEYQDRGETIPWLDPATKPSDQQQVRWMALHL
ncbi:MAG: hypothetical protein ACI9G1_005486 [Pirellulaceae bacterium]|jgi:molybdopterin synthase catalytic subunit